MEWNIIKTKEDVEYLNDLFGNFHDSCLKEICFSSGCFILEDYSMNPANTPVARFLFQRQWKNPSAIEIEFKEILQVNIKPVGENQFNFITIARLYYENDIFFWNANDYEMNETGKNDYTWIASKFVQWRIRDDLLGSNMVYMRE